MKYCFRSSRGLATTSGEVSVRFLFRFSVPLTARKVSFVEEKSV